MKKLMLMKGTYVLLISLNQTQTVEVGSLGEIEFHPGHYAYVGSALKNLESRIERHYQENKNFHWHIDYLLSQSTIKKVIFGESDERKECRLAQSLAKFFEGFEDFGSSDCSCRCHLFYSEDFSRLEKKVEQGFDKVGLVPKVW